MRFERDKFIKHGEWLSYTVNSNEHDKFVARFKHTRSKMGKFITFLIKNFEVEEYFHKLEVERKSPSKILEAKGYDPLTKKQREQLNLEIAQYYKELEVLNS